MSRATVSTVLIAGMLLASSPFAAAAPLGLPKNLSEREALMVKAPPSKPGIAPIPNPFHPPIYPTPGNGPPTRIGPDPNPGLPPIQTVPPPYYGPEPDPNNPGPPTRIGPDPTEPQEPPYGPEPQDPGSGGGDGDCIPIQDGPGDGPFKLIRRFLWGGRMMKQC